MSSIEFVHNWIKKMSQKYPHLKIRYYFENFDNTHYIFLDPIDDYLDGEFGNDAYDFELMEFIPTFPYENLAFLPMEEYRFENSNSLIFDNTSENRFFVEIKNIDLIVDFLSILFKFISETKNNNTNSTQSQLFEYNNSDENNLIVNYPTFNNQLLTKNLENAA